MRFTITTALFVLFVLTVFASPLPIDSSLEGRNVPAARSVAVSVERRTELEIPKRQGDRGPADWKRAVNVEKRTELDIPKRQDDRGPADWKRAVSVERRTELEIPKRQDDRGPADWKRAEAGTVPPDWKVASPLS